ncbi:GNAT family N-acetyltransferase [Pseudoflavonifractor sp. An85]|uniref:GNAT family N-acetyltransferase n=1 Tax=Pseudoflavonifractor sp. An85 TaxID=1965661 RepID=UPI0013028199|nr:GNAT family N-acetyltransferase [Pseudoflavonifractor sp. An85]
MGTHNRFCEVLHMRVNFYEYVDDELLRFAVIIARHNGKWVFCKHRERDTYELPGGHREPGEQILDTAKRELQEETGAIQFSIHPVCVYSVIGKNRVNESGEECHGMLYVADIETFQGELHSEMEQVLLLEELPTKWTYPQIQPLLVEEYLRRCGMSQVEFLLAQVDDAPVIAQLRKEIWSTTYRGIYPDEMIDQYDLDWHTQKDVQRIENPDYAVYLIQREGRAIGYITLHHSQPPRLLSLYLKVKFQNCGIGHKAMEFVKGYFKAQGAKHFTCQCQPDNAHAMSFYQRNGGNVVKQDLNNEESWQNSVTFQFDV